MPQLEDQVVAAIGDPGGAAGDRRGPSWPRRDVAYAPQQETHGQWAGRAVMATLEQAGALLPRDGKVATFRPGGEGRPSTAVIQLDGPREIFRFMIHMLDWQCDLGSAARGVLVDLRDHLSFEPFDEMARTLLGGQYERRRDQFLRDFCCDGCETDIRVGARYFPTREAGAVCARCCKGFPEYEAKLVKRLPEPVPAVQETAGV